MCVGPLVPMVSRTSLNIRPLVIIRSPPDLCLERLAGCNSVDFNTTPACSISLQFRISELLGTFINGTWSGTVARRGCGIVLGRPLEV